MKALRAQLLRDASPRAIDLAILRVVVFALLLTAPDTWSAARFAELSPALRSPPFGMGVITAHLPIDLAWARAAQLVLLVGGALALVGYRTRIAAGIAALAALYLLGLPQLYGTVRHYHHLVWFAMILAVSPSGDVLSIDAMLDERRRRDELEYAVPLWIVWALVGGIFFFAGYWKWRTAGLRWALSDNLVQQMRWKWLQSRWLPWLRIDQFPSLCRAGALLTMIFEVGFVFALPFRRMRPIAVAGALLFHLTTWVFMRIGFLSLALCYVAFLPIGAWLVGDAPVRGRIARAWPALLVGGVLLAGGIYCGARGIVSGWPFACYPTFQHLAGPEMPALEVELVDGEGHTQRFTPPPAAGDSQRAWGLGWSLALHPDPDALAAYVEALCQKHPIVHAATRVHLYRALRPVDPARWDEPGRRDLLLTATGCAGSPPRSRRRR